MKNPIPTRTQIIEVRRLLATDLCNFTMIARWTGVPLRDVFRLARPAIAVNAGPSRQFPPVVVTPDGKNRSGAHLFDVARKSVDPILHGTVEAGS